MNKIKIMEASVRKWDRIIAGKGSEWPGIFKNLALPIVRKFF